MGQTLIETLVAIFVLTTGLISASSLAIYSFRSSDNSAKQIVATALAREASEAIKNIRDNNWLNDTLTTGGSCGTNQKCYPNWLGSGQNALRNGDFAVDFNPQTNDWTMTAAPPSYLLYYDSTKGTYSSQNISAAATVYSRKVNITEETVAPYDASNPRLNVIVTVWWQGRSCPVTVNPAILPVSCKIILQSYLTNWRNY